MIAGQLWANNHGDENTSCAMSICWAIFLHVSKPSGELQNWSGGLDVKEERESRRNRNLFQKDSCGLFSKHSPKLLWPWMIKALCMVFFGQPDPNHFAIWPVPKLGDLGSARALSHPGGQLDRNFMGPYAATFAAPEMNFDWKIDQYTVQFFDHWDSDLPLSVPGGTPGGYVQRPAVLSSRTNIWQIGMLMLCAIRLEPELLETQWRVQSPNYPVLSHQAMGFRPSMASQPMKMRLDDAKSRRYSRQLLTLVKKCLVFDPDARISPQQLLQKVQNKMVGRDGGMMTARGRFPHNHPQALWMSFTDRYKVGKKPHKPRKVA
ncbi:hypothetical protein KCU98_g9379, partial [Aureobasidium melanogenum]